MPIFQELFEDITINVWFTTFNNKNLGNFKVRATHSKLKGMDDG